MSGMIEISSVSRFEEHTLERFSDCIQYSHPELTYVVTFGTSFNAYVSNAAHTFLGAWSGSVSLSICAQISSIACPQFEYPDGTSILSVSVNTTVVRPCFHQEFAQWQVTYRLHHVYAKQPFSSFNLVVPALINTFTNQIHNVFLHSVHLFFWCYIHILTHDIKALLAQTRSLVILHRTK